MVHRAGSLAFLRLADRVSLGVGAGLAGVSGISLGVEPELRHAMVPCARRRSMT